MKFKNRLKLVYGYRSQKNWSLVIEVRTLVALRIIRELTGKRSMKELSEMRETLHLLTRMMVT